MGDDFSLKVNSNILPARALHFLNGNNQIQNTRVLAKIPYDKISLKYVAYHNVLLKGSNSVDLLILSTKKAKINIRDRIVYTL